MLDPLEVQAVGRGGGTGCPAVAGVEHVADVVALEPADTDLDEGTDDDPHLIPQESVSSHGNDNQLTPLGYGAIRNRADRRLPAVAGAAEGGVIHRTDEVGSAGGHGVDVHVMPAVKREVLHQNIAVEGVPDQILVAFVNRITDGVKPAAMGVGIRGGDFDDGVDHDVVG